MKEMTIKELSSILGGKIIKGEENTPIRNIVTKSSKIEENSLLFNINQQKKLPGLKNRTHAIVTDIPIETSNHAAVIIVKEIYDAYWKFVDYYRNLFNIPVIGVTGTCGKTTTTEMVKTILSKKYKTNSTNGNNAWYISLPYLLAIDETVEAGAYEMGVGAPGHLKFICRHYKPQVGVLMNIGTYHLLGCETLENYIKAKAELLEGLGYEGTLVLNADDENTKRINLSPFKGNIIYFGLNNPSHFKANEVKYSDEGMEFIMAHNNEPSKVYVPGYGEHNVYNALAAIAATYAVGISPTDSINALTSLRPIRQHMQLRPGINGSTIIDDTWNCTPLSMETGLKVLKTLGDSKKTIAVLGYMPQLGAAGEYEYHRIGKMTAEMGIDFLVIIGEEAKKIGIKAIETGLDFDKVFFCSSAEQLYNTLYQLTEENTLLLFKFPYKYRLSKYPSYRELMKKIFK